MVPSVGALRLSEEDLMGQPVSFCRVFIMRQATAWPGVILVQHCEHIIVTVIDIPIVIVMVICIISWTCLHRVGHPLVSPSQVASSKPQGALDCPWGAKPRTGLDYFRGTADCGHSQVVSPTPSPNRDFFILPLWVYYPGPFARCLLHWGLPPQRLLLQRRCPAGNVSRRGHSCVTAILFATLTQELPKVIIGIHCCTLMTLDHISSTTTYVIWREERILNVRALKTVHLSNLVDWFGGAHNFL
jgi:hypothetical protein